MKMIDVLTKLANGEIKDRTILDVYDQPGDIYTYTFDGRFKAFYDGCDREMANDFNISNKFLNYEVELIPPKEKKYLIKVNIQGLYKDFVYLNYFELINQVRIYNEFNGGFCKTHFTKSEMQSIQPIREFLEDMKGKYELIEVTDDEDD